MYKLIRIHDHLDLNKKRIKSECAFMHALVNKKQ